MDRVSAAQSDHEHGFFYMADLWAKKDSYFILSRIREND